MKQPELGKKISQLRKEKGLTQEDLVEKCNINVRTIQRIESGEVTPRSYTLKTILTALDYDWEEIKTDFENTISISKNHISILNLSFWVGIVFVIALAFAMFVDLMMYLQSEQLIGFQVSEPLYMTAHLVCVACAFVFYLGFFTTGKLLKNTLLKVSAILFMVVEIISSGVYAFMFNASESTALYYSLFVLGFYGCVGIPFGIGLLKLQKHLGQYATLTGIFTIVLYATMLTVILIFISLFLWFPVMILQLILLYKIREYFTELQANE
ncbi:MAG: helix-turn-helix transcriptional regulator [Flavobacteriaceae bacterium]